MDTIFADDLNSFKGYAKNIGDDYILKEMKACQVALHRWGNANGVLFDPGKEHFAIVDSTRPYGKPFEILGTLFDTKLTMYSGACAIMNEASRRLRMLMRARRYYKLPALFRLYKAHVLPYAERSTPAISYAHRSVLC